jgi:hypothetical protein
MTILPVCNYYTPATGCELNRLFPQACRLGCPAYTFVKRAQAIQNEWHSIVYPDKPREELSAE